MSFLIGQSHEMDICKANHCKAMTTVHQKLAHEANFIMPSLIGQFLEMDMCLANYNNALISVHEKLCM